MTHKGIHSRGYLPHWDFAKSVQAITFRLGDSLPVAILDEWKKELEIPLKSPDSLTYQKAKANLQRRISQYEDTGRGNCVLSKPAAARIVQDAFVSRHGIDYKLIEWCVMPNHVHVLIRILAEVPLGKIVKTWKATTAIQINRAIDRSGSLWMEDYYDRYIRDLNHLYDAQTYIRNNPVKAKLCEKPEDWEFSSAGMNWRSDLILSLNPEEAE